MALIDFFGFDNEDHGGLNPVPDTGISFQDGRDGTGKSMQVTYVAGGARSVRNVFDIDPETNLITIGAAIRVNDVSFNYESVLYLQAESTFIRLDIDAGTPRFGMDSALTTALGTEFGTGSAVAENEWNYFEIQFQLANAGGIARMWQNETQEVDFTGDTLNISAGAAPIIGTHAKNFGSAAGHRLDDVYILDDTGAAPFNDRLGPVSIPFLAPDGQSSADFVGSDANSVDNHLLVDEIPASMADYVESATATDTDVYTLEAMPAATPLAVRAAAYGLDTDGLGQRLNLGVKSGATTETVPRVMASTARWSYSAPVTDDPNGAGEFTESLVNSLEFTAEVA